MATDFLDFGEVVRLISAVCQVVLVVTRGCTDWSSGEATSGRSGGAGEDTWRTREAGRANTRLGEGHWCAGY
jgi:hypothetical protein